MNIKSLDVATQCIQAGFYPENGEPRVAPIIQSTTYKYNDADEVGKLFDLEVAGHMYSRLSNPTCAVLEEKISVLEGGVGAVATSSGQSAVMFSIINIASVGDHFIAMSNLYGGTLNLFKVTLKKMGIDCSFVNPDASLEEMKQHVKPNTKAIFGETIGNPSLGVLDFEKVSKLAKYASVPLIIDNTFATPYLCRPFEHGADIVVHSTTKYIDGHATSVGGILVDSGKFNWANGKFPDFTTPDNSYHGLVYCDAFKESAYITKARVTLLRDIGCTMSPFNAWLTNLGAETLAVRMDRHCENALALAKFLQNHPKVSWVNYPALETNPSYELSKKYLPKGASGIVAFGVKGGVQAGKNVINNLKVASLVVHLGDLRTHLLHPASMTHRQLSEEDQILAGLSPDLIRLSVGIENINDLINDLDQALNHA
ncbi:O-acetylhomoserine aminocarboxypropyltransferase [Candidatus Epulonipiscium fishelsonii]|uniref:O-acetylhomoserine aminocarboxypropyltransferase n=1 Tax=Candidatus Epulonipiscium fishelsonii TaxID=77094 RepID=A0ACC8X9L9_9FIRM|nr:O-acetylhomoserine aminocarboxypropyltransferase [Epulopiscium sp. SCG-B11WGA-EpuloA1]ONI40912.1 O-acetylhomoserine aminocarboxypropyltransferase [Epulopiscium sp. SCG-B05WGA-EpuloA1]